MKEEKKKKRRAKEEEGKLSNEQLDMNLCEDVSEEPDTLNMQPRHASTYKVGGKGLVVKVLLDIQSVPYNLSG